jgi:hypothetical protein
MIDQVLGAVRIEAKNTNCLKGFQVGKSIGGGTSSGMGTREKPLTAASSRCQQVRSAPHLNVSINGRGWASGANSHSLHDHSDKHEAGENARRAATGQVGKLVAKCVWGLGLPVLIIQKSSVQRSTAAHHSPVNHTHGITGSSPRPLCKRSL